MIPVTKGDDTLYGGKNENILIGDYGQVIWINEIGDTVARQGGGMRIGLQLHCDTFKIC